jgi:hypothetical protein
MEARQHSDRKNVTDHSPNQKSYWTQWKCLVVRDMLKHQWELADGRMKTAQIVV